MSAEPILETRDIRKSYGSGEATIAALDGVSIRIEPGSFVAIMGPSGSGKSTLMHILGCLDRPTSGTYRLAGEEVSQLDREQLAILRNRRIGFVFQAYNLLARATALDNVLMPLIYSRNGKITAEERLERARKALEVVGLADRESHRPHELSGGQQQRVAIARALINDPALILADEPTGNLDSASSLEIMGLLEELHARGRTIVMVTHSAEMASHAERIIHLKDGRVESVELKEKDKRWARPESDARSQP
jgi:ABC-type lipoprotein export system ATPase subunit